MSRWISIPHRIAPRIQIAIVIEHTCRIGHERVRRDELADLGIVIAGVVIHQPCAVQLLAGEPVVRG
jgi:hypothetical protein